MFFRPKSARFVSPDIIEVFGKGEASTLEVPSVLEAKECSVDGWSVWDTEDGAVWWPSEEAAREIRDAEHEEQAALCICITQPARGEWGY